MDGKPALLAVVAAAALVAVSAWAQDAPWDSRRALGLGAGLGSGAMSVGGRTEGRPGLCLHARVGLDPGNHFLLMAESNPFAVKNPVMDESFRALNVILAGSMGDVFRIRPGLGLQFRAWSGTQKVTVRDTGPVFCLDAGYEWKVSRGFSLCAEFVFRSSLIGTEGNVTSGFFGLQAVALREI